jgi:hypothetical protein
MDSESDPSAPSSSESDVLADDEVRESPASEASREVDSAGRGDRLGFLTGRLRGDGRVG